MRITPPQIEAAMGLAGVTAKELATITDINPNTLGRLLDRTDTSNRTPHASTLAKIKKALEDRGVEFTENEGVRRKTESVRVYQGPEGFDEFSGFLVNYLSENGGDVCLSVDDEELLFKYRTDQPEHRKKLKELCENGHIKSFRVLANKSKFAPQYATYKKQESTSLSPTAFYAFGDCLALISFAHVTPPYVVLLESAPLAESYRKGFDAAWSSILTPPITPPISKK